MTNPDQETTFSIVDASRVLNLSAAYIDRLIHYGIIHPKRVSKGNSTRYLLSQKEISRLKQVENIISGEGVNGDDILPLLELQNLSLQADVEEVFTRIIAGLDVPPEEKSALSKFYVEGRSFAELDKNEERYIKKHEKAVSVLFVRWLHSQRRNDPGLR